MAASQARLLTITARIHDVEYQAQAIQNAKVQLATQSDQVYNEYLEALDATSLTVSVLNSDGSKSKMAATFNNLCSVNSVTPAGGENYAFLNKRGQLIVTRDIFEGYERFKNAGLGDTATDFALFMLGIDDNVDKLRKAENSVYSDNLMNNKCPEALKNAYNKAMEIIHEANPNVEDIAEGKSVIQSAINDGRMDKEKMEEFDNMFSRYQDLLYKSFGEQVYGELTGSDGEDFNYDLFQRYEAEYNKIQLYGGTCVPITDYDGPAGDAGNDNEWLTNMIACGSISCEMLKTDAKGKLTRSTTSPSDDISLSYTNTSEIDKKALAKAEAKYEHDLKEIDKKDKAFDMTLSKLETERTALTTEYDSVKKVIEDNIERTFGIFS